MGAVRVLFRGAHAAPRFRPLQPGCARRDAEAASSAAPSSVSAFPRSASCRGAGNACVRARTRAAPSPSAHPAKPSSQNFEGGYIAWNGSGFSAFRY
jgi:hypothetical protein